MNSRLGAFWCVVALCFIAGTALDSDVDNDVAGNPRHRVQRSSRARASAGTVLKLMANTVNTSCASMPKQTFNDIGYSLLGYNIMYGYPLAEGRDPGFMLNVFAADYSTPRYNADCRYLQPRGLDMINDESCVTSFTSTVVKTQRQLSEALGVNANIGFERPGGLGPSFKASTSYKQDSKTIADSESVIILSEAQCKYFYSLLDPMNPPPLHPSFIKRLEILHDSGMREDQFIDFFNAYGTHYTTHISYGARYVRKHKMQMEKYLEANGKSVSVSIQASYSGAFSLSGGFGMDYSKSQSATDFENKVETTTVTIGATPPANGDAMTWASTVQNNPMPMEYDLAPISELITEDYLSTSALSAGEINTLRNNMVGNEANYCEYLQEQGVVTSCRLLDGSGRGSQVEWRVRENVRCKGEPGDVIRTILNVELAVCVAECKDDRDCVGVLYNHNKRPNRQCVLKKKCGQVTSMQGVTTVQLGKFEWQLTKEKSCANEHQTPLGDDIEDSTFNECFRKCQEEKNCVAMTLTNTDRCSLKTWCGELTGLSGVKLIKLVLKQTA